MSILELKAIRVGLSCIETIQYSPSRILPSGYLRSFHTEFLSDLLPPVSTPTPSPLPSKPVFAPPPSNPSVQHRTSDKFSKNLIISLFIIAT